MFKGPLEQHVQMPDNPTVSDRLRYWWENYGIDHVVAFVVNAAVTIVVIAVLFGAVKLLGAT